MVCIESIDWLIFISPLGQLAVRLCVSSSFAFRPFFNTILMTSTKLLPFHRHHHHYHPLKLKGKHTCFSQKTLLRLLSNSSSSSSSSRSSSVPLPQEEPSSSSSSHFGFGCSWRIMEDEAQIRRNYPIPLSPPLPSISKEIELNRAMSASVKSAQFSISRRNHVIFEDEWLVVVNKPAGVYCESVLSSIPQLINNNNNNSAPSPLETIPAELHLANRLDRDTSGLMVITKSHKVAGKLVKAFTDHKVIKTYIALCIGSAPNWEQISLKSGHGRSKFGVWRVYAASDVGRSLPGGSSVRDMATSFQVLSINGQGSFIEPRTKSRPDEEDFLVVQEPSIAGSEKNDEVLIRAYPRSGRTHQIRLHCQYLGIPIRGDVKYEGIYNWKGVTYDAHSLHAESLLFDHPITGVQTEFRAPLPLWASQIFQPESERM